MGSEPSSSPKSRKPVLGSLSLALFFLAPLAAWLLAAFGPRDEWGSIGSLLMGLMLGVLLWLGSLALAIAGFYRSERPRWPAIAALSLITAAVVLYLINMYTVYGYLI